MKLFKRSIDLLRYTHETKKGAVIAFVPTMGALHHGHISLIKQAKKECDIVVTSIFVNPTQFNEASDLKKYPITTEADIDLLAKHGCDILYLPSVEEVYPENSSPFLIELGYLDNVLEGEFRPGHFKGVAQVLDALLNRVKPHSIYMGQKDYQQLAVTKVMLEQHNHSTQLVSCPIKRHTDGLAMSSRNVRLLPKIRKEATILFKTLSFAKENRQNMTLDDVSAKSKAMFAKPDFRLEYFDLCKLDLSPATEEDWASQRDLIALVACWAGEVRLIDNMFL